MRPSLRILCGLLILPFVSCAGNDTVIVYAASSLTVPLERIIESFRTETGQTVQLRTGSSSTLAVEIENGAPADLFLSADETWIRDLETRGILEPGRSRVIAWNRLAFAVPSAGPDVPERPGSMVGMKRFVIADPDVVPLGRFTEEALRRTGFWIAVEEVAFRAPDARTARTLLENGEMDGGILYATDVTGNERLTLLHTFAPNTHAPIVYVAAPVRDSRHAARAAGFLEYLSGPAGRAVLRELGFGGT